MRIFLAILASIYLCFVIESGNKDKLKVYSACYIMTILAIVAMYALDYLMG
jgi:hypothetical protein